VTVLADEVRESLALPVPAARKRIRQAAGVSQLRLAAELGVSRQAVYRYEKGDRTPRGHRRLAYARLLADLDRAVRTAQGSGRRLS